MKRVMSLFLVVFLISFAYASENLSEQEIAENCLSDSRIIVSNLNGTNISLIRFNDMLGKAESIYDAQMIAYNKTKKANFNSVISYCEDISRIDKLARDAIDGFEVLISFYHDTLNRNMDTSSVDKIMDEITEEINGERYENVKQLIDDGYSKISSVKTEQTTMVLAYKATSRTIRVIIVDHKVELIVVIIFVIILYVLYKVKIVPMMLNRKLKLLKIRKGSLRKLMGESQKLYFQEGKISESDYRTRIKNYADLVRDIDRQIPLVQAEIAKRLGVKTEIKKASKEIEKSSKKKKK